MPDECFIAKRARERRDALAPGEQVHREIVRIGCAPGRFKLPS